MPPTSPPPEAGPATNAAPPDGAAPPVTQSAPPAPKDKAVTTASCTLEPDDEFIGLDWTRRKTYQGICLSARWLDSLFGDDPYDLTAYPIEGFVGFDYEQRKDGSPAFKPRVRMRVKLPNLSKRLDLFFERDDENKTIVGESDSTVTRQLGSGEQNTSQVGLGYEFMRGIDSLLNFRAGLRLVNGTIDPFVRSRYSLSFAKEARSEWRFGQSLFWRHIEGFGETTSLDYENRIGGPFIFRWNNSATVSQITESFRWGSTASVLHPLDEIRTLLYSYSAGGDTGTAVPLASYGPRVSYRQQLHRRWLFGEVYVGNNSVKSEAGVERKDVPYIGAKIEAHFKSR